MSIIYEALKKVELSQSHNNQAQSHPKKADKPKINVYLIYALVVIFGIFMANIIFGFITKTPAPVKTNTRTDMPVPEAKKETPPSATPLPIVAEPVQVPPPVPQTHLQLTLNGIFFSGDEAYALINNEIVKEGDQVKGATVKKVTLEGVELDEGGSIIKINNAE